VCSASNSNDAPRANHTCRSSAGVTAGSDASRCGMPDANLAGVKLLQSMRPLLKPLSLNAACSTNGCLFSSCIIRTTHFNVSTSVIDL
jgi:hypothetical protein